MKFAKPFVRIARVIAVAAVVLERELVEAELVGFLEHVDRDVGAFDPRPPAGFFKRLERRRFLALLVLVLVTPISDAFKGAARGPRYQHAVSRIEDEEPPLACVVVELEQI